MLSGATVGQFLRDGPRKKDEIENTWVAPISAKPVFLAFPVILVPRLSLLPGFDLLAVFCHMGTKNIGYAWLSP